MRLRTRFFYLAYYFMSYTVALGLYERLVEVKGEGNLEEEIGENREQ